MTNEELVERIEKLVGELEDLKTGYAAKLAAKQKEIDTLVDSLEDKRAEMEKVIPLIEDSTKKVEGIEDIATRSAVVEKQSQDMEKQIEEARKLTDKINGFEVTMDEVRSEMTESQKCFQDDRARLEGLEKRETEFEKQLKEKLEELGNQEKNISNWMIKFDEQVKEYKNRMDGLQNDYHEIIGLKFSIKESIKKEFLNYILENIEPIKREILTYVLGSTKIIKDGWLGQSDQPLRLVRK